MIEILPYFMDYETLWTIRCTLIFKQFLLFLLLDCKARLKKFLVYKTELTFKISENSHFFSYSLLAHQLQMVFSVGGGPKCRSAALFPSSSAYGITFKLQPASYEYLLLFSIMKLATNKIIVLLPTTQITFNSSSLAPQTYAMDCNDATQARHCSEFVMAEREGDRVSEIVNPHNSFIASVHCCRQMYPMLPDRDRFPTASNIWPF